MKRFLLLPVGLLVLVGCGGLPVQQSSGTVPAGVPDTPPVIEVQPEFDPHQPSAPPPASSPSNTDNAVDELLSEAIQLRDKGDIDGAIAVSERALRIAPRSPRVYYVLGTLKLDKGEADQALQLALKASSLDADNFYRRSIDRLITDSETAINSWQ